MARKSELEAEIVSLGDELTRVYAALDKARAHVDEAEQPEPRSVADLLGLHGVRVVLRQCLTAAETAFADSPTAEDRAALDHVRIGIQALGEST